jgi:hypothetical protein
MIVLLTLPVACSSSPWRVPPGYLETRFTPAGTTFLTVAVGARLAVKAVVGDPNVNGWPTSMDPEIIEGLSWPSASSAPRDWYAFEALSAGRGVIQEKLPCGAHRISNCTAAIDQIFVTVKAKVTSSDPEPTSAPPFDRAPVRGARTGRSPLTMA